MKKLIVLAANVLNFTPKPRKQNATKLFLLLLFLAQYCSDLLALSLSFLLSTAANYSREHPLIRHITANEINENCKTTKRLNCQEKLTKFKYQQQKTTIETIEIAFNHNPFIICHSLRRNSIRARKP